MNTDTRPASYPLRLETETRAKLEAIAKASGRSLNAQIVLILEGFLLSHSDQDASGSAVIPERIKEYVRLEIAEQQSKLEAMAESIQSEFAELAILRNRVGRDLEKLEKRRKAEFLDAATVRDHRT